MTTLPKPDGVNWGEWYLARSTVIQRRYAARMQQDGGYAEWTAADDALLAEIKAQQADTEGAER